MINFDALRDYDRRKQVEDEVRLWRGVIYKAMEDTASRNPVIAGQAKQWLLEDCGDYYDVCGLAGFDPMTLRNHIRAELS